MAHSPAPSSRSAAWPWLVCGVLLLATALNYMDRLTVSASVLDLHSHFGHSDKLYGATDAAFGVAFAVGSLVSGWMADRWGVYWLYPVAVLIWSAAGFLTGFASGWYELMACRFVLGLAESAHWPCALRTTQHLLAPGQRSMGNGLLQSGAALASIITPLAVLALVPDGGDWRRPFWVVGALGLGWVALWLGVLRPGDLTGPAADGTPSGRPGLFASLAELLRLRRFWVLVVLVVAVNQPWQFFRAWLVPLLDALHYSRKEALLFSSAYYTAADAGSLAAGFLTLAFLRRGLGVHRARLTVYLGAALLTAVSVVAAPLPAGPLLLGLLLVIAFGSLGLMPTYYSFTQDLTVRHQGLLTGLLGFTTWLVTAAMQLGVGKRLEETGTHGLAMAAVGLVPLIGFAALIFCWKEKGGGRPAPDSALPVGSKAEAGD